MSYYTLIFSSVAMLLAVSNRKNYYLQTTNTSSSPAYARFAMVGNSLPAPECSVASVTDSVASVTGSVVSVTGSTQQKALEVSRDLEDESGFKYQSTVGFIVLQI